MCQPIRCRICGKTTWTGCGSHIEQVLGDVAPADRCQGHARGAGNSTAKRSWFGRRGAKV